MLESSDKMWSTGEGDGKSFQYSCFKNPMEKNGSKDHKHYHLFNTYYDLGPLKSDGSDWAGRWVRWV